MTNKDETKFIKARILADAATYAAATLDLVNFKFEALQLEEVRKSHFEEQILNELKAKTNQLKVLLKELNNRENSGFESDLTVRNLKLNLRENSDKVCEFIVKYANTMKTVTIEYTELNDVHADENENIEQRKSLKRYWQTLLVLKDSKEIVEMAQEALTILGF